MSVANSGKTELFAKWQGGRLVVADQGQSTGNRFWVGSTVTGASDTAGYGRSPDAPFATLDYALSSDVCTAGKGDVIYLMEGHTEAIVSAGDIAADIAGVRIVGLGKGNLRPTFTYTTADTADFDITAANVSIENCIFDMTGYDGLNSPLHIAAAGVSIIGCDFEHGDATGQADCAILTTDACDNLLIDSCYFYGSSDSGTAMAIDIVGGDDIVIRNCFIDGYYTANVGGIRNATTASNQLKVEKCIIINNTGSSTKAMIVHSSTTGVVVDSYFGILSGTAPVTGVAIYWGKGNYYANAVATAPTELGGSSSGTISTAISSLTSYAVTSSTAVSSLTSFATTSSTAVSGLTSFATTSSTAVSTLNSFATTSSAAVSGLTSFATTSSAAVSTVNSIVTNTSTGVSTVTSFATTSSTAVSSLNSYAITSSTAVSTLTSFATTSSAAVSTISSIVTTTSTGVSTVTSFATTSSTAVSTLTSYAITSSTAVSTVSSFATTSSTAVSTVNSIVTTISTAVNTWGYQHLQQDQKSQASLTSANLFTYTGTINIKRIVGTILTTTQDVANTCKLSVTPDALGAYDICSATSVQNKAGGTLLDITGTAANGLVVTASGALAPGSQVNDVIATCVTSGTISVTYSASGSSGTVRWDLCWEPVSIGATVAPA